MADDNQADLTKLTVELLSAYLANNKIESGELPTLIASTRASLSSAPAQTTQTVQEFVPAVGIRKSLASKDAIISLIDGKPYKTLKRHLTTHGLTADEYRARYKLPSSYPLVAPSYSERRREVAAANGLGRAKASASASADKPAKASTPAEATVAKPAKVKATAIKASKAKDAKIETKVDADAVATSKGDAGPVAKAKAPPMKATSAAKQPKAVAKKAESAAPKVEAAPAAASSSASEPTNTAKPRRKLKIVVGGEATPEPKAKTVAEKLVAAAKKFTVKKAVAPEGAEVPAASSPAQSDDKVPN